jgi:hypothetical protein
MIPFGKSIYLSEKDHNELATRINWQIEICESILFPRANTFSARSTKPLVGKINDKTIVTRLRPFYEAIFPQIFVRIKIEKSINGNRIALHYHIGLWASILFLFFTLSSSYIVYEIVQSAYDIDLILDGIIWILLFPGITILLAARERNRLNRKLIEIFDVENEDRVRP